MKNLNMKKKIVVSFGVVIICFIISLFVSIFGMNNIGNRYSSFYHMRHEATMRARNIRLGFTLGQSLEWSINGSAADLGTPRRNLPLKRPHCLPNHLTAKQRGCSRRVCCFDTMLRSFWISLWEEENADILLSQNTGAWGLITHSNLLCHRKAVPGRPGSLTICSQIYLFEARVKII